MVATMSIYYDYGGVDGTPASTIDIDPLGPPKLKFKLADNASIDTANPIVIPVAGAGPYNSALKHIYLYCDNPDGHTISAVKFWTLGTNNLGVGVDWKIGLQFPEKNSGSTAGYEVANANPTTTDMVTEHGGLTSSASIFNYTAASPLAISISEAGNVINLATETTNYTVHQMSVANTAGAGTTNNADFYFSYDEV